MSFAGKNFRYLRKLRGWTQEEFANKAIGNVKQEINLDGINPGIYILNISINGKETSLKIVKE